MKDITVMSGNLKSVDLDLRGSVCPMAFVRLRMYADGKPDGDRFTVLFEDTLANEPLVRSIKGVGHRILQENLWCETEGRSERKGAPALKLVEVQVSHGRPL